MSINVLIMDNSVTYRKMISDILRSIPDVDTILTAPTSSVGLKKLSSCPTDLVFLDININEKNGFETLEEIRSGFPSVAVVMMTDSNAGNKSNTIDALQCGAVDFISKYDNYKEPENILNFRNDVIAAAKLVELRKNTISAGSEKKEIANSRTFSVRIQKSSHCEIKSFTLCVIGVSTGGPEALSVLLPLIPADFPIPILIVQHMPAYFTKSLAENLNRKTALRVVEAPDNCEINTGTIYIAPGGRHMKVRSIENRLLISHSDAPPENSCRPSADVLFRSVSEVCPNSGILAIILTGMGSDGCNGVKLLKKNKCFCITQSSYSCVIYGMPKAVDDAGLSDISLPIEDIAGEMVRLTSHQKLFVN